ncbi:hypothetical protein GF322_03235 [Candidatus Dependentiae bacterium]|nr:hypothetical protein [Candidatus Dependentiae bacterium]
MLCEYYQVKTQKVKTWFVVGCFRNEDNLAFERTLDLQNSILEFFVPPNYNDQFLNIINWLINKKYILNIKKMENRLINEPVE